MKGRKEELVRKILEKEGKISRNQALSMNVTRLGAAIDRLKKEGYAIDGEWTEDKSDYVYILKGITNVPKKAVKVRIYSFEYDNLYDLEIKASLFANRYAKRGKNVVMINFFEPVLNVISKMFSMPKRNVVILSKEKNAFIEKFSFNITDVYEKVREMFYENKKISSLIRRVKNEIKKGSVEDRENVFIVYGFNEKGKNEKIKKALIESLRKEGYDVK